MKVSKKTDYALRAVFVIAEFGPISARELSEKIDVPKKFLDNILVEMIRVGWIKSTPGRYGGYSLSKDKNKITLGEIIRYFEGMLAMISCVSIAKYEPCSQENSCYFRRVFLNIRNLTAHILDNMTIASCIEHKPIATQDIYKNEFIGGLGI